MAQISISGFICEVAYIAEYARGPNGRCAFCNGDPCNEYTKDPNAPVVLFYKENPRAETCPCCEGRPT